MFDSILVICTANICRSPIGERILQRLLPNKIIASAGVQALVGHQADATAKRIAASHNIFLDGHEGKQFTPFLAKQYDLILAMDRSHIERLSFISPESRGKTMLFGHWINQKEIPDPYRKSEEAYTSVYSLIEKSSQYWVNKLS